MGKIKDNRLNKIAVNISTVSPSQRIKDDLQYKINSDWSYAPDVYTIEEELAIGSQEWSNVEVRINHVVKNGTGIKLGDDWKELIYKNSNSLYGLGHRYKFDTFVWIIINTDYYKYSTYSSTIRRCNYTLKWYDRSSATPILVSEPCIIDYYKLTSGDNVDEAPYLRTGSNIRYAILQYNNNTNKLRRDDKFIIDGRAYRIIDYDGITKNGLFTITLEEYQINQSNDDVTNNIANVIIPTIESGKLW